MSYKQPNSINTFRELIGTGNKEPARSNLFQVVIDPPPVMTSVGGDFAEQSLTGNQFLDNVLGFVGIEDQTQMRKYREHADMMNYYADTVSIPGRRITVGTVLILPLVKCKYHSCYLKTCIIESILRDG